MHEHEEKGKTAAAAAEEEEDEENPPTAINGVYQVVTCNICKRCGARAQVCCVHGESVREDFLQSCEACVSW
jgi:hypothetical protein